jgi:predicted CXXCH cytochrome family protein
MERGIADMKRLTWAVCVALMGVACTNDKIVFRTRPPFNPPPDSVNGFLGYFDVPTRTTTCGNCHVEKQASWVATKHAHAWTDLQASGHASASCNGCHTVSQLGNNVGHAAGYLVKPDSAYHDVQCETCHGPGFAHVQNPTQQTVPLASIHVDTGLVDGCGGCHTGVHEPFVDQWKQSAHGSGPGFAAAAANASCAPCHEGKTALTVKFGVTGRFVEKDSAKLERIVCVVCHDPHGSPNSAQLRASISSPSTDNLCVTCHSRSGTPPWGTATATSAARGPHGAQGLLVLGLNIGWIPPNFTYDTNQIVSSHGTLANPRLCATCHVARTTVTDKATGAFTFQSVGHLFSAIPCTDSAGIPTTNENCTVGQRDFSGCTTGGCHGTTGAASSAFVAFQSRLDNLLDQIWVDVDSNGVIDSTDTGILAQMVLRHSGADSAALNFGSTTTTVAKGTLYNAALAATSDRKYFLSGKVFGKSWAAHMASGNGVHNPFLLEALLTSSIAALHTASGLSAPLTTDLRVHAKAPPGVRVSSR